MRYKYAYLCMYSASCIVRGSTEREKRMHSSECAPRENCMPQCAPRYGQRIRTWSGQQEHNKNDHAMHDYTNARKKCRTNRPEEQHVNERTSEPRCGGATERDSAQTNQRQSDRAYGQPSDQENEWPSERATEQAKRTRG